MNARNTEQTVQQVNTSTLPNAAWITWEVQVRNRSMSNTLGVSLHEVLSNKSRLIKYPLLIVRTIHIIVKNRIKILFVQNPSIVLSFLAVGLKPVLNLKVVVDAHNSGIYPLEGKSKTLNYFARLISRKASYVIVTNSYLAKTVAEWGGRPFVMPDPIPDFSHHKNREIVVPRPYMLFICTWASDEPYFEVIKAAAMLSNQIDIYITGNYRKHMSAEQIKELPPNVKLLGFVSEDDYIAYFRNAIGAIDLTTRDNCLVCGGYEAVALGVPAVLSQSQVNEEVFFQGCVLSRNDTESIAESIAELVKNHARLTTDINTLKAHHLIVSERTSNELLILLKSQN